MDRLTVEQRRKCMRAVKSKNTSLEMALRKALYADGLRYRLYSKDLPGRPDIVFRKKKVAVFCDGEFWHGFNWLERKKTIQSNQDYWFAKIERNMARDAQVNAELAALGWTVVRFWEREIKKQLDACVLRVRAALQR